MGYITIKKEASAELIEKKSRFLAQVRHVETEQEALDFLNEIRANDRTASHNVFAYRLRDRNFSRYSDAGEPSGTAGLPVLDVLERADITDAVIVVTRWFGGTLLGTGGLVRAYGGAARLAVEAAGLVRMEYAGKYSVSCSYSEYERLMRIAADCGATLVDSRFDADVTLQFTALPDDAAKMDTAVHELTRGKGGMQLLETQFLPMDIL